MRAAIILILLVITFGICYAEEPTTERPTYSAGDYWVMAKEGEAGNDIKIEFLSEEKGQYVFRKNGEEYITDFNLTPVEKKTTQGYPGPVIKFPLKTGKWWTFDYKEKEEKASPDPTHMERSALYKVEAYEEVTVPAGTFWAFKVSVSIQKVLKQATKTLKSATYWYAPSVKHIIKSTGFGKKNMELKEYKIQ